MTNYRMLPGVFNADVKYHFDGLATILKLSVSKGKLSILAQSFASKAYTDWDSCMFFGTGTGPTLGSHLCFMNPAVNLLPIAGQLWLTIDTSSWGRVDPQTLATIDDAKVDVGGSFTLNAHPTCDPVTRGCFVQHPCPTHRNIMSNDACISQLLPSASTESNGSVNMATARLTHAKLPYDKLIQHSHSPCITPRFIVAKLDAFHGRTPDLANSGMLRYVHQGEDDLWLVMDRSTNASRLLTSPGHKFVNNHFWNCYEEAQAGDVVVESVPATSTYLDLFFARRLSEPTMPWPAVLPPALRCRVPASDASNAVKCAPMFDASTVLPFDYPTYNPLFKMRPYRFFYAIAAGTPKARLFDTLIKVDRSNETSVIVARWSSAGVYLTEADFLPRTTSTSPSASLAASEDDGLLLSVLYNSTSDQSLFAVFDAKVRAAATTTFTYCMR